ncbi:hypothetical protein LIER_30788 [Lithospermum erythrorhizon]|uniref:Uncharacterized protein n=1 Tax=Lithospermum erythrorhizon TaxID=34254 RepID=A0AAV3RS81_LITER
MVGRIATISRGIYGGRDSRNSRNKYTRIEVCAVVGTQCSTQAITFTYEDCQGLQMPHDDPIGIAPKIAHFIDERMLVHTGSSKDILYLSTFDKLCLPRSMIHPMRIPLTGFTGHSVYPPGVETLTVTMGTGSTSTTIRAHITVVDIP